MIAEGTVTDHYQLRLSISAAHFLKRFNESGEAVSRVESAEKQNYGDIGAQCRRAGNVRVKDVGVDAVGYDRPVCLEISIERYRRRVRHRDRRIQLIEPLLEVPVADGVEERPIEIGVEGTDDRAVRFLDRHHRQHRAQRRVHMDDVVLPEAEYALEILSQLQTPRESGLRAIRINRLAVSDANYVGLVPGARKLRRDNVDLVPVP